MVTQIILPKKKLLTIAPTLVGMRRVLSPLDLFSGSSTLAVASVAMPNNQTFLFPLVCLMGLELEEVADHLMTSL